MDPPRDPEEIAEGSVLSPEELDFTDEEEVEELDESRFVIGAEGRPHVENRDRSGSVGQSNTETTAPDAGESTASVRDSDIGAEIMGSANRSTNEGSAGGGESRPQMELRGSDVKRWISANLERTDSQYAYRLAAKTGDDISHQQLASDDIGMAFDGLLMWYAQQVGDGTAVEDTLGILLAESNIRVRFPVAGMVAYLERHGLSPDDSIGELLAVIRDHDGLVFPRGTNR